MGRTLSARMSQIFGAKSRKIDHTIDLNFPDGTSLHFATAPLTLANTYTNDLEKVGEIRQTLESATDQVSVALQNKDRAIGLHVAEYWRKWQKAEAVIGRYYRDDDGLVLDEWKEMFRGSVQQPNANDLQVTFSVIADTLSPGQIVSNRTLAAICGFVFKDPKTCRYTGTELTCDHHLKSKTGCDGKGQSYAFGGTQHRYLNETQAPGTGGNTGGGTYNPCPRLNQYILVRGNDDLPVAKMVCFLSSEDYIYHPIKKTFHAINTAEVVRNVEIYETISCNGAVGYTSGSHLWIRDKHDDRGFPVERSASRQNFLTLLNYENLIQSKILLVQNTGELGDVMRIEMADGHIYATGDSPTKLGISHNSKQNPIDIE